MILKIVRVVELRAVEKGGIFGLLRARRCLRVLKVRVSDIKVNAGDNMGLVLGLLSLYSFFGLLGLLRMQGLRGLSGLLGLFGL